MGNSRFDVGFELAISLQTLRVKNARHINYERGHFWKSLKNDQFVNRHPGQKNSDIILNFP